MSTTLSPKHSAIHKKGMEKLPTELVELICGQLSLVDLLTFTRTCKLIYGVFKRSITLQYEFQLALAGMEDVPCNTRTKGEKWQAICNFQEAQSKSCLKTARHESFTIQDSFAVCDHIILNTISLRIVELHTLPGPLRGVKPYTWRLQFKFDVYDYFADVSQDLFVALEFQPHSDMARIRALSLQTGERHPLASNIELHLHIAHIMDTDRRNFRVRVCGRHIAAFVEEWSPNLTVRQITLGIWDWRSGHILGVINERRIRSFVFFDENHLAITHSDAVVFGLSILDLTPDHTPDPSNSNDKDKIVVNNFWFPQLNFTIMSSLFLVECRPIRTTTSSTTTSIPQPMFRTRSEEDSLAVFTLILAEGRENTRTYSFLVPVKRLLELGKKQTSWSWEEWGPQNTRFIFTPRQFRDYPPSGWKHAILTGGNCIDVYDFNPKLIRKLQKEKFSAESTQERDNTVDDDVKIPTHGEPVMRTGVFHLPVFMKPVVSKLPCRKYSIEIPKGVVEKLEEVYVLDDGLALLDARNDGEGDDMEYAVLHAFLLQ